MNLFEAVQNYTGKHFGGPKSLTTSFGHSRFEVSLGYPIRTGLTYEDVLLEPQSSDILSRRDVSTAARFTRNVSVKIPIVSANMDTVTESVMAIAMARHGGIGIIHRFISIEEQTEEVRRVERI